MDILIVEPDKVLARTYQKAFEHAGHRVNTVGNAQAAIFAADSLTPDLVLLEIQLVSHSGIEFLYEFRSYAEWQDIPVVILSIVPPIEFADSWNLLTDDLKVLAYHYKPRTTLAKLIKTVDQLVPLHI